MSTLKANKDKARFVSNTISQDALDGDWIDHEVVTKYKLPEIVIDASTTESLLVSPDVITTGDKLKVLDGANMVERTAGTVTVATSGGGENFSGLINEFQLTGSFTDTLVEKTATINTAGTASSIHIGASTNATLGVVGSGDISYRSDGAKFVNNNSTQYGYGATFTDGDVIKVSVNTTNNEVTFYKNGVSQGVAGTMSGATGTVYIGGALYNASDDITYGILITTYQAPITATTNIPTKAFFNKTIDTTLSAEDTGKCKSSTITQIGVL